MLVRHQCILVEKWNPQVSISKCSFNGVLIPQLGNVSSLNSRQGARCEGHYTGRTSVMSATLLDLNAPRGRV